MPNVYLLKSYFEQFIGHNVRSVEHFQKCTLFVLNSSSLLTSPEWNASASASGLQPHFDSQLQDMKQAQPVNHQEKEHLCVTLD
jgi:hypothetical protein